MIIDLFLTIPGLFFYPLFLTAGVPDRCFETDLILTAICCIFIAFLYISSMNHINQYILINSHLVRNIPGKNRERKSEFINQEPANFIANGVGETILVAAINLPSAGVLNRSRQQLKVITGIRAAKYIVFFAIY
jgi:hypothetical protein